MANIKANAKSSKKSKAIYLLNKTKKNSLKKLIKLAQTTKKSQTVKEEEIIEEEASNDDKCIII